MAQYNSKHTGSQIDAAVTRALSGGAIDQDIAKKMDATESTDYPGCYYRMSNNVKEWLNPPMVLGTEYRITDRYLGKPVYTQAILIGAIGSGSGNVEHGIADISVVVGLIGANTYSPTLNTHLYMNSFFANRQYVRWETTQAISGTSYAVLRYTKTTD